MSGKSNIEELVANITHLLEDRECWSNMGAAGRNHVEAFHNISSEIPRLESIYARIIVGSGNKP